MVELPAMLRLQAQAEGVLERGQIYGGKAAREARRHHRAFADDAGARFAAPASVQPYRAVVEVCRHAELAAGGDRGCERPREPARRASGRELERRDEGEAESVFARPGEDR